MYGNTVQARQQLIARLQSIAEINEAGADLATRQRKAGNITALELANQAALYQEAKVELDRKILAELAVADLPAFGQLAETAKSHLSA